MTIRKNRFPKKLVLLFSIVLLSLFVAPGAFVPAYAKGNQLRSAKAPTVGAMGMEVTQAIQNLQNTVPLVADKRTVVRVYLRSLTGQDYGNVMGMLVALRPDGSSPGGIKYIQSRAPINVSASPDVTSLRKDLRASLNFDLPPAWTSAGKLVFAVGGFISSSGPLTCGNCVMMTTTGEPIYLEFSNVPAVHVRVVNVPYTYNGVMYQPRDIDRALFISWLRRAYPTSKVEVSVTTLTPMLFGKPDVDITCASVDIKLMQMQSVERGDARTKYYGLVADGAGFMRGCAPLGGVVGSGPVGEPRNQGWAWDSDTSYGDWYGGHELGHEYGRNHIGFSGPQCVYGSQNPGEKFDEKFPYANGHISGPRKDGGADPGNFGYDAGDESLQLPERVYDPATWTDIMSYCQNQWISDYTYLAIAQNLFSLESHYRRAATPSVRDETGKLVINGILDLARHTVARIEVDRLPGGSLTELPASSQFQIVLRDGAGKELARYQIPLDQYTDEGSKDSHRRTFTMTVPSVDGTAQIDLVENSKVLASLHHHGSHTPTVKFLSPQGGEIKDQQVTISWQADNPDGDPLKYTVLASADGGKNWDDVAQDVTTTSITVPLSQLPDGDVRLRVIATDGFQMATADTQQPLQVRVAPKVQIIGPEDTTFFTGETVVFTGQAYSLQRGAKDIKKLVWKLEDGTELGQGESISVSNLSAGKHTVTFEATEEDGTIGSASLNIEVKPMP